MADKLLRKYTPAGGFDQRFKDNGDGSYSQQVALPTDTPSASNATIANGQSLSAAVDLTGKYLVAICMPAAWTAANLTFQVSNDGVTYYNLYTSAGVEYVVTAAVDRCIVLPPSDMVGIRYIKVRSGTAASAVAQGAERVLPLVLRTY